MTVFLEVIAAYCFGYPFAMSCYWMAGGVLYHLLRGRHEPPPDSPPALAEYPPVSILVPCRNEAAQLDATFAVLREIDYPDYEVIAINDGSTDRTGEMLDALAERMPQLRVVHLESNQGKSTALNSGALAARHEILVCIDGDALLDPHALTWLVRRFQSDAGLGALTGNPRIRNRASLLGRLQVGEFSSIVGLIKRAQTVYGQLFTVSGVICAFRKRALHDAGWWARDALTDDVDVSWRIQLAGWRIAFEPSALCWILMPETLVGLWNQRLRWSEGGTIVMMKVFSQLWSPRSRWNLIPVWASYVAAIVWAYAMLVGLLVSSTVSIWRLLGGDPPIEWPGLSPLRPEVWGTLLGVVYVLQVMLSVMLDWRFERGLARTMFWVIWYPIFFWVVQAFTAIVGLARALFRKRPTRGTWVSPDRGIQ